MSCFRNLFCFTAKTLVVSAVIYFLIQAYMGLANKIQSLQLEVEDVHAILREQQQQHATKPSRTQKPPGLCSTGEVESVVQRYTNPLKTEIIETKRMVEQSKGWPCGDKKKDSRAEITRTDFALECLGSKIEYVTGEPFGEPSFIFSILGLGSLSNEPRNVLNPSMQPGNCYAFQGCCSEIVIRLMGYVFIDSVGIEHIAENASPDGTVSSAPKDFSVYGLETINDKTPFHFGTFVFDASSKKKTQVFNFVNLSPHSYRYIKFKFESNHGHPQYTCIYRLTVHGKLDKLKNEDKLISHV